MARILVIDDDKLIRVIFKRILRSHEVETIDATHKGIETLIENADNPYDVVFMDYNIDQPGDGKIIIEAAQKADYNGPFVAIGDFPDRLNNSGLYQERLRKPIDRTLLRELVNRYDPSN